MGLVYRCFELLYKENGYGLPSALKRDSDDYRKLVAGRGIRDDEKEDGASGLVGMLVEESGERSIGWSDRN